MFSKADGLKSIKLPNITALSTSMFNTARYVETIDLGAGVDNLSTGSQAFAYCYALKNIIFRRTSKITYSVNPFSGATKSNITIYVPSSALSVYKSDSSWTGAGFKAIEAVTNTIVIDNSTYSCNEGETWLSWVSSLNNTDGLIVVGNLVMDSDKTKYVTRNGNAVFPNSIVVADTFAYMNL